MNEKNLRTLVEFLRKLPEDEYNFSMDTYAEVNGNNITQPSDTIKPHKYPCKTVCCAVGWSPVALNLKVEDVPSITGRVTILNSGDTWWELSKKYLMPPDTMGWDWCFTESWVDIDNTAKGASARILCLLDKGIEDILEELGVYEDNFDDLLYDASVGNISKRPLLNVYKDYL